jgi:hypothetical protein
MTPIPWGALVHRVVIDGAVLSTIATALILLSLYVNPRLWLQDLPRDVRDAVIPGTEGLAGDKNYGHHFRGFLIGLVLLAIAATLIAAAVAAR